MELQIEIDVHEGIRRMGAAATAGKAEAQTILGDICRRGIGVRQDYEFARGWYLLAAEQGNASAQYALGDIFYQGLGVSADHKIGADWYEKAAAQGDMRARVALASIYRTGRGRPVDQKKGGAAIRFVPLTRATRGPCTKLH